MPHIEETEEMATCSGEVDGNVNVLQEEKPKRRRSSTINKGGTEAQLELKNWGLPNRVVDCYAAQGILKMFPWQAECLLTPGVLCDGANLVYSAPTSAGKTFVAELLVLKRVLEQRCKALIILPFVSLAREKMLSLQKTFRRAGLRVEGYMGSLVPPPGGLQRWDVAVCTLEKANSLLNKLIEEGEISQIGCLVVDELHTVADPSRGYLLELLLSKLRFLTRKASINTQLIGMSATVSNVQLLADWLDARLYTTDYRPVPLTERLLVDDQLKDVSLDTVDMLPDDIRLPNDPDYVVSLCVQTILCRHGVLVFCCSRAQTEKLAENVARLLHQIGANKEDPLSVQLRSVFDQQKVSAFLDDFRRSTDAVKDTPLIRLLHFGVAFHHAGLTMEERDGVERGFRSGCVRVVVATSTLSAGVNLPAKRVIIRSPWGNPTRPGPCLTPAVYKQMVGRAGRKGIDTTGESILICKPHEVERGHSLMTSPIAAISSTLLTDDGSVSNSLKRALLEAIAGRLACSVAEVESFVQSTLLGAGQSEQRSQAVHNCLQYAVDHDFVVRNEDDSLEVTQLGSAAVASALGPELTLAVYEDLQHARRNIVLENDLHLVFLVTPMFMLDWGASFSWSTYHDLWCRLPADLARVGSIIGVNERYLVLRSSQRSQLTAAMRRAGFKQRDEHVHMRFYTALALHDLVNEQPLRVVAERFGCARGFLQQLQQNASSFAGMVVTLCDRLGWTHMHQLLAGFAERLAFGIRRDLTELVRIDGMDGSRARCFHAAGYKTLASVATAQPTAIQTVLAKAVPFEICTEGSNACRAWLCGHPDMSLTDAAALIHTRAVALLQHSLAELGIENIGSVVASAAKKPKRTRRTGKKRLTKTKKWRSRDARALLTAVGSTAAAESSGTGQNGTTADEQSASSSSGLLNDEGSHSHSSNTSAVQGTPHSTSAAGDGSTASSSRRRRRRLGLTTPTKRPSSNGGGTPELDFDDDSPTAAATVERPTPKRKSLQLDDLSNNHQLMVTSPEFTLSSRLSRSPADNLRRLAVAAANSSSRRVSPAAAKSPGSCFNDSVDAMLIEAASLEPDEVVSVQRCQVTATVNPIEKQSQSSTAVVSSQETDPNPTRSDPVPVAGPLNSTALSANDPINSFNDSVDEILMNISNISISPRPRRRSSAAHLWLSRSLNKSRSKAGVTTLNASSEDMFLSSDDENQPPVKSLDQANVVSSELSLEQSKRSHSRVLSCSPGSRLSPLAKRNRAAAGTEPQQPSRSGQPPPPPPIVIEHLRNTVIPPDPTPELSVITYTPAERHRLLSALLSALVTSHNHLSICVQLQPASKSAAAGQQQHKVLTKIGARFIESIAPKTEAAADECCVYLYAAGRTVHCIQCAQPQPLGQALSDVLRELSAQRGHLRVVCLNSLALLEQLADFGVTAPLDGLSFVSCSCLCWLHATDQPPDRTLAALLTASPLLTTPQRQLLADRQPAVGPALCWLLLHKVAPLLVQATFADSNAQLRLTYARIVLPIPAILAHMRSNGLLLDVAGAQRMKDRIHNCMHRLEKRAHELAGRSFSLSSPAQVADVLYNTLRLTHNNAGQAAKGNARHLPTNKQTLTALAGQHALPAVILDWRQLDNALSTALLPLIHAARSKSTIRVSSDLYTATGRICTHSPNVQCVPKLFRLLTLPQADEFNIRRLIVPPAGHVLVSADYCQLELRVLAHLSGDPTLIGCINDADAVGRDVFKCLAANWLALDEAAIDDKQRHTVKQILYGILYGMGVASLSEQLGVTETEAEKLLAQFKAAYPRVFEWMSELVPASTCGRTNRVLVRSLLGRVRCVGEWQPMRNMCTNAVQRRAVNTCVQSSAADLFRSALCAVHERIRTEFAGVASLVLQMHDELLLCVRREQSRSVLRAVHDCMTNVQPLAVALRVRLQAGPNWADLTDHQC